MSLNHSPSIITDSLVLHLDAQNIKSYSGTTTWFDTSGLGNNGTMYGTVPVVTTGVKYFDFATVTTPSNSQNATLGFTFASNMVTTTGDFTFSTWVKDMPTTVSQSGFFSNTGSADGYRFGVGKNGIYYLIGPTYKEGTISFLSTISDANWHNIVAVFRRSALVVDVYLDGVYQSSSATLSAQTAYTNATPGMVRSGCCTPLFTGKVSLFSVNNKALSAAEISQNFTALRGRYGI
jgi:hypothetical protein